MMSVFLTTTVLSEVYIVLFAVIRTRPKNIGESISPMTTVTLLVSISLLFVHDLHNKRDFENWQKNFLKTWFESHFISLKSEVGRVEGTIGKVKIHYCTVLSLTEIFVGQLKSELRFDCDHRSVTFDPFWDLSVPIPKVSIAVSYHWNSII